MRKIPSFSATAAAVVLCVAAPPVAAQTSSERIVLTNGEVLEGEIAAQADDAIWLRMQNGHRSINLRDIQERTPISAAPSNPAPDAPAAAPRNLLRFAGSNTIGARLIVEMNRSFLEAAGYQDAVVMQDGETPQDRTLLATNAAKQEVSVSIGSHGSGTAFSALRDGAADIGMASRQVRAQENEAVQPFGLKEHVIGLDGVLLIVHPDNPLKTLSLTQAQNLFSGRISNWRQIDPDFQAPVAVFSRDENSGTFETFKSLVMREASVIEGARRFESNADLAAAVSSETGAIGFIGGATGGARALAVSQACGLSSTPDEFAVKTEEYPLSRRLYLYERAGGSQAEVRRFMEFAQSDAGQEIVKEAEFVDLRIEASKTGLGGEAIRRAILLADPQDMNFRKMQEFSQFFANPDARRLSVTFRFDTNSRTLDARALPDVRRLAAYWRDQQRAAPQRRLAVFGFADSVGGHPLNDNLSTQRATEVANRLRAEGVQIDQVGGWGELAPVACDLDEAGNPNLDGQRKNRRVEIWLY